MIGNSGLIKQSYNQTITLYENSFLEDLSVTVVDNDEAALVIAENKGPLMILEDSSTSHEKALDNILVNEYSVVLTRAPQSTVRFTVKPVELSEKAKNSGAKGIEVRKKGEDGDWKEDGITLFFTKSLTETKKIIQWIYYLLPQNLQT